MSSDWSADAQLLQGDLVDYYADWGPKRFRLRSGKPLGKRALEVKIHEFGLPVIRTGRGALIDPVKGDARLREYAQQPREKARRRQPVSASV
jgi:hypothetical protein